MIKDVSIGRYYQADSVLHRLDPRVKVFLFIVYMVTVFIADTAIAMAASFGIILYLTFLSRIPVMEVLKSVRPIVFIMIFIFLINIFTIRSGEVLWSYWVFTITRGGLQKAVLLAFRLLLLILATSLLLRMRWNHWARHSRRSMCP